MGIRWTHIHTQRCWNNVHNRNECVMLRAYFRITWYLMQRGWEMLCNPKVSITSFQPDMVCLDFSVFLRFVGKMVEGGWSVFSWFTSFRFLLLSHLIVRDCLGGFPRIVTGLVWGQQSPRKVQSWEDRSGSRGLRGIAEGHGWLTSQSFAEALFISIHSLCVRLAASTLANNTSEYIGFLYTTVWTMVLWLFVSNLTLILINFSYLYTNLFKLTLQYIQLSLKIIQKSSAFHSIFGTASASHEQPKVSNLLLTPSSALQVKRLRWQSVGLQANAAICCALKAPELCILASTLPFLLSHTKRITYFSVYLSTLITESQAGWGWKEPLEGISSKSPTQAGVPRPSIPGSCIR